MSHSLTRPILVVLGIALALTVVEIGLVACGPFISVYVSVTEGEPPFPRDYANGSLGVIKPSYRSRYLIQAYRVLHGLPPLPATAGTGTDTYLDANLDWHRLSRSALGDMGRGPNDTDRSDAPSPYRLDAVSYASWENCPAAAFTTAIETLNARRQRWGASSPQLREWVTDQVAVFANCHTATPQVPPEIPAGGDALLRADRDYQIAAAHFYATDYDAAVERFLRIARDPQSPWRLYGKYLAARATVRKATVARPTDAGANLGELQTARDLLDEVIADPSLQPLHASATGLVHFIDNRLDPSGRLLELSARLSAVEGGSEQDLVDFSYLLRRASSYATHPLLDWIRTVQNTDTLDMLRRPPALRPGTGEAFERWRDSGDPVWLVAAFWVAPLLPASAQRELEQAADAIPTTSPAYESVSVLHLGLLMRSGRRDEARALLARLPATAGDSLNVESLNIVRGARMALAPSLEDFIANATRTPVGLDEFPVALTDSHPPMFDEDAATMLTEWMPLSRLVDVAISSALPSHLRPGVLLATLTRALTLERPEEIRRLAPAVTQSIPALSRELDGYLSAPDETTRSRRALLMLVRRPVFTPYFDGPATDWTNDADDPLRLTDNGLRRPYWWCGFDELADVSHRGLTRHSSLTRMLYGTRPIPSPAFLTDDERAAADRELRALGAWGNAKTQLARQAIDWARARPTDLEAAEALSRVVNGWRYSCGGGSDAAVSQQAFQTLHRIFPKSEWAARTKYWYR